MFSDVSVSVLVHQLKKPLCSTLLAHELFKREAAVAVLVLTVKHSLHLVPEE